MEGERISIEVKGREFSQFGYDDRKLSDHAIEVWAWDKLPNLDEIGLDDSGASVPVTLLGNGKSVKGRVGGPRAF